VKPLDHVSLKIGAPKVRPDLSAPAAREHFNRDSRRFTSGYLLLGAAAATREKP